MDDIILISNLNDFIFCPVSIYFHGLYGGADVLTFQTKSQLNGTKAHESVDTGNIQHEKILSQVWMCTRINIVWLEK